ncbi:mitochondrial carrier domain-containing protein [Chytridium lagenaria]|nr:mitochondrial carrier domain-containing protein [Chytridium lagenaria]
MPQRDGVSIPLPGGKDFIAGSFAGMAQVAIGHPLDTVKVRLQLEGSSKFKGPLDCIMKTVKYEGILGLYKGMAAPLAGIGFVNAVLFSAYGFCKDILKDPKHPERPLKIRQLAAAGAGAGIINAFVAGPIELLKIRLQAQYTSDLVSSQGKGHLGPMQVARGLVKDHGVIRGLFHGTWSTVVREIPAYAGFYGGFDRIRDAPLPVSRLMIAGAVGGIMYWTCCYPLDVVKSRIQNAKPGTRSTAILTNLSEIYVESGLAGLFRGYVTSVIRSIPAAGATFTVYELTMRALST